MGALREVFAKLQSTNGGSSETELKLLAVIPVRAPSEPTAVMIVIPVVNAPSAWRNSRASNRLEDSILCDLCCGRPAWSETPEKEAIVIRLTRENIVCQD